MITLKSLIKIAPLDEEKRTLLLEKIEKNELNDNQKLQLSTLFWDMTFKLYEIEWSLIVERMIAEQAEGKKIYTPRDFTEERVRLITRFTSQLEESSSAEELEEIRKKLASQT